MKRSLFALLSLTSTCLADPPAPGEASKNVTFSLGGTALSGSNFASLKNGTLSDFEGKVVLLAYYTPW
ncbi:MAG: hypothetical protein ACN4GG_08085 [Akkermansiaceae bacterium]